MFINPAFTPLFISSTKMHHFLLLLSLATILSNPAASSPPFHTTTAAPRDEYIEITRPLPFDSLTPSCTLPLILSHNITTSTNITYTTPPNCAWSNAVLHFSATSTQSPDGRIAAVCLSGAEILRTSTPHPIFDETFWSFRKDVTRYASLLRQSNLTLTITLDNGVNDVVHDGIYQFNLTFIYYDYSRKFLKKSLELNKNPADLILPVVSSTTTEEEEGFWFKIEGEKDEIYEQIQIPPNTYRAVIEICLSFHNDDEFWYSNPPNFYIELNNLSTQKGNGAYREILLKLDNNVVGSVIPFPAILTGGMNPLFWKPIVPIGAFNFPTYEVELTPFLGLLLDEKVHHLEIRVINSISYWLVNANLHLWLDDGSENVAAGLITYRDPSNCIERESKLHHTKGEFEVESERRSEYSGWVKSSAGNFTCRVHSRSEFENTIKVEKNGTVKSVKQDMKAINKVEMRSNLGNLIANVSVERRYPLHLKMKTDGYKMSVELEQWLKEEKKENDDYESESVNRQRCEGWMMVGGGGGGDDGVGVYGKASSFQSLFVEDSYGCYGRRVSVENGAIDGDSESFICAVAAS